MKYVSMWDDNRGGNVTRGFTEEPIGTTRTVVYDNNDNVLSDVRRGVSYRVTFDNGDVIEQRHSLSDYHDVYDTKQAAIASTVASLETDIEYYENEIKDYQKTVDSLKRELEALIAE
jgi:predicted ribosome quality control (RQC) complex YloA/Tae2 family protein